jgi:hypothetical protein
MSPSKSIRLKVRHRDNPESANQPIGGAIPIERLSEYGALMREFAVENGPTPVELPSSSI